MAFISGLLGGNGGIDMSKSAYPPTGLQTVNAGGIFKFSCAEEPKLVFVTYLLTTASQYFRVDICDVVNNRVMMYSRTTSGVWMAPTIYQLTDEIAYDGSQVSVTNEATSGSRQMYAVAFY